MKKLYKYRPLSDLLFKELYYQELYFASYIELNDPLDLSARIEFSTDNMNAIEHLIRFVFRTHFSFIETDNETERRNISKMLEFINNRKAIEILRDEINKRVHEKTQNNELIWTSDIVEIIEVSLEWTKADIYFDSEKFVDEIQRLTNKFLKNSYTTCFSETNDDFLMWSHYSSKHSGVCLEFTMENEDMFPYESCGSRKPDSEKYKKRMSNWETNSYVFWDNIRKVNYEKEQPFINFFNFAAVFENEHDCDLIGLSKSWTHKYAHELELVFSTKTNHWKYENEWRAIEINFDKFKEPEERIRHYPIESLSSIYFGVKTPENIKRRIYKIFEHKHAQDINYYDCVTTDGRELTFCEWKYDEDIE